MKKLITILALLCSVQLMAQDYYEDFQSRCSKEDSVYLLNLLQKWEKENPKDPELFVCYFNYYFVMGRDEMIALMNDAPGGQSLSITDSTGESVGYLGSQVFYEGSTVQKGIDYIDKGIAQHPKRLDMRFGKIYTLGELKDWDAFTKEIIKTIKYSKKIDNAWLWSKNTSYEDGEKGFLLSLQDYQLQLYNTYDDNLLLNMREIGEEVLKYYPQHVESLSNISISYIVFKEYDKAIEYLKRAEEIDPKDNIVLTNIAHAYVQKGDKKMAIEYYKKARKLGDKRLKEFCDEKIKELEK